MKTVVAPGVPDLKAGSSHYFLRSVMGAARPRKDREAVVEPSDTPAESEADARPLTKRQRSGTEVENAPPAKHQRRDGEAGFSGRIQRPGVPPPTNTAAFVVPDRPSPPHRADDKDGHYVFELGENLTSRYKVLSKMGEGTFGRVLECWDRKNKDYVAIKIVRNVQKYRDAAMIELEVLHTLEANDPGGSRHCVSLREWFDYRGHVCMVFEKLGLSLYDFLRKNSYRPFHVDMVRAFGRQLLEAVAYLHSLGLIHTDLKPENILLCTFDYEKRTPPPGSRLGRRVPASSGIKVIDFGSATFDDQYHSTVVSTRHYRAPEVILGTGWSFPCDIWSIGCIMVELVTGDAVFQTHENLEHLAMMEQVLGAIPESIGKAANRSAAKYFTHRHRLNWPEGAQHRRSVKAVQKLSQLQSLLAEFGDASVKPHLDSLVDLLKQMLRYDPRDRIKAEEALRHPFFQAGPSDSS
ncbi:hypothetical protein WJX72_003219 [[Myrmecia] bisecta]|uniref:Protein kinase domain-containing protein n=1 Tax=[Myrmecia] bisecta TaxID=41462 RepID=A0AAW1R664_9CHLO